MVLKENLAIMAKMDINTERVVRMLDPRRTEATEVLHILDSIES